MRSGFLHCQTFFVSRHCAHPSIAHMVCRSFFFPLLSGSGMCRVGTSVVVSGVGVSCNVVSSISGGRRSVFTLNSCIREMGCVASCFFALALFSVAFSCAIVYV